MIVMNAYFRVMLDVLFYYQLLLVTFETNDNYSIQFEMKKHSSHSTSENGSSFEDKIGCCVCRKSCRRYTWWTWILVSQFHWAALSRRFHDVLIHCHFISCGGRKSTRGLIHFTCFG